MKQITCEICGGKNIIKRDGAYVCADCGIKYTADEIKKLLSNAPDDEPACREMPLENLESTPSNSTADRENPDKINHKSKIPLIAFAACVCVALLVVAVEFIIPNVRYNNAVSLMNDGKYEEAIASFEKLGDYKDCKELIDSCNKDKAYYDAVELLAEGETVDAYESLIALDGYSDSSEKAEEIYEEYKREKIKVADVGDIIYFGTFEQDSDISYGKEDIKWLVLEKKDNKLLVISKKALCNIQYNKPYANDSVTSRAELQAYLMQSGTGSVTWESCTLRAWLNSTFLEEAFSESEQQQIQTTTVLAENNSQSDAEPGNDTDDKMFLLSTAEFEKYCTTDELRTCAPTAYAISSSADTSETNKDLAKATCVWWLRTQGTSDTCTCVVDKGNINYSGENIAETSIYVRPAMWIDLSA